MADIHLICPNCGGTSTFSEFADASSYICRACGQKMAKPKTQEKAKRALHRRLDEKSEEEETKEREPGAGKWQFQQHIAGDRNRRSKKKVHLTHHILSWFLCAAIALFMYMVRYRHALPVYEQYLRDFGPIIVAAFYVLILLKAFKDSVFHGVMSLLIPPYALYYVFLYCDDFYLRAVFAGALVGVGEDALAFYNHWVMMAYYRISAWIGGGALK